MSVSHDHSLPPKVIVKVGKSAYLLIARSPIPPSSPRILCPPARWPASSNATRTYGGQPSVGEFSAIDPPPTLKITRYLVPKKIFFRSFWPFEGGKWCKIGKWTFFLPGYDPPAPQKGPKIEFFRQNFNFFHFFTNFYQKPPKIIEFYLFDGLESCASKFRAYLTKNQIFRPSGCRDWAQTLSRSSIFHFFHFFSPLLSKNHHPDKR